MLIAEQLKNLDNFKEKYKNLLYSHYFRNNYYVHFGAFYSNIFFSVPKTQICKFIQTHMCKPCKEAHTHSFVFHLLHLILCREHFSTN